MIDVSNINHFDRKDRIAEKQQNFFFESTSIVKSSDILSNILAQIKGAHQCKDKP